MGGEPVLEGTRVPVSAVVETYRLEPDLDRLGQAYPMLDRAALEDALSFYRANRQEIDRYIAEYDDADKARRRGQRLQSPVDLPGRVRRSRHRPVPPSARFCRNDGSR